MQRYESFIAVYEFPGDCLCCALQCCSSRKSFPTPYIYSYIYIYINIYIDIEIYTNLQTIRFRTATPQHCVTFYFLWW